MKVSGYNRQVDHSRLGSTTVLAASLILAVRTARREAIMNDLVSNRDWEQEIEFAFKLANLVVRHATARQPGSFPQKDVPWYEPTEDESPK